MRLLLDTHLAFWLIAEPHRMSRGEVDLVQTSEVAVSAISIWEFRIKWLRRSPSGSRKGPIDPHVLLTALQERDLRLLPLTPVESAALLDPPLDHNDPFDELLLVQAQQGGYRLLTRDEKMKRHPAALVVR